jgi:hypothetical protein
VTGAYAYTYAVPGDPAAALPLHRRARAALVAPFYRAVRGLRMA